MSCLVFDCGGTSVKYALADREGELSGWGSIATPSSLELFLQSLDEIVESVRKKGGLRGLAFSFPGEVHSEQGDIGGISAIPYIHGIPLKQMISSRYGGLPVSMENDANCASLGELWKGVAAGHKEVIFVICGTGIGGAAIEGGKLRKGITGNRAEFGNYPMGGMEDGVLLTWSDHTLEKQARKYNRLTGEALHGRELFERAESGDGQAKKLLDEFYHWMAVGCININFSFDPEFIAIGGGISSNRELIAGIQERIDRLLEGQRPGYLRPQIRACAHGNKANLYGALYHFLNEERKDNR
ncbi:ROK family protein [Lacrimispora sp. 210928-DFI.3.58]|uniref:ROK family protein n=1 Tax=Lacrimispora sp. 210928-DFI.3.58 TaxID=2883214 RepID=UPI001D070D4F|nr:ROK family protein [Lacrimispora sp. 210928-DFI.3.58]MCB7318339.1 ROK family protein [Lacrimispora sp. 210928-DFI.3.58]